jgi:hypothetical protein
VKPASFFHQLRKFVLYCPSLQRKLLFPLYADITKIPSLHKTWAFGVEFHTEGGQGSLTSSAKDVIDIKNMKLIHLLSLSSLVPALFLVQSPARAVPGWAQTSIDLQVPPSSCKDYVRAAIKKVTGSTSTFDKISNTTKLDFSIITS